MRDLIVGLVLGGLIGFILTINYQPEEIKVEPKVEKYDIVKFCQEMSATRTHDSWGYKDCLTEMEKALKEDLLGKSETI